MAEYPIIVEGPDGAGKTTLAQRLATHLDREYRRPPPEALSSTTGPASWLAEWWDGQLAMRPSALAHGVYDRCFYISDPIYQQAVVERDLLIAPHQLAHGIMRLWNAEPFIIFCLPDFDVILTNVRHSGRPQLEGVGAQELSKIWNAYWAYYAMWSQALFDNVMVYDYKEAASWARLTSMLKL